MTTHVLNGDHNSLQTNSESQNDEDLFLDDKLFMLISSFHIRSTTSLRDLMRRTGMVISGSAALALIHPNQFLPNDLDFYVLSHGFPAVLKYVEDHGYKIEPYHPSTANYFHQNIIIVKLIHPVSGKSINVVTNLDNHVIKAITRFHSTVVMNYLSWFGLVVLYPKWTLKKSGLLVTDAPSSEEYVTKYVERGYTLHRNTFELTRPLEPHVCRVDAYCPSSTRSLHDGECLVEAFEPAEFDFIRTERDMSWTLPVSCSFDN